MVAIESLLHRRTDLSTFVVHFTKDSGGATARQNLAAILENHTIEARTAYGMVKDRVYAPEVVATQRAVCFTETPLEHAWMMCEEIDNRQVKFNGYGIAFTKTFARKRGVNPVWYLDITPGHDWLTGPVNQLVKDAEAAATPTGAPGPDTVSLLASPILRLTPFLEQMGPTQGARKEFWWEREWRHVGDFVFTSRDIVVVFAPESEHDALREEMATWPGCAAPPAVVDAKWGLERVIAALAHVRDPGPFPK
ncbi:abortive infection system antitoxin AbiGi family protein [Allokutzneria sp. A3M-2-11 16]|uniref:abortive infection system antitoxin AbiGi family protein n=1 Tax=Allokutzneria sp. A3M-2-11 16 TaxID=2962043 RepID=UPI0020B70B23|nr:abortive infection system antitoxin AbiGi family protein [Allokutzneria sp. A3M-2-11 16]MCP3799759.1 abortive infection system antitoxin AbiGi family protein [Allokutzneria sp. A3M-2-11 16]